MFNVSTPANPTPSASIRDVRTSTSFLPIEVGEGNGDDHFWLIMAITEWYEAGRQCAQTELRLRCRHCNFGYNSGPFTTVRNFVRMGEEAEGHVDRCLRSGRTIELISPKIEH